MTRVAVAGLLLAAGVLRADPPPGADAFGDPLPPGAVARLGTARLRHSDEIQDIAFSPDGTRLAVTTRDGRVSVWDAHSGRLVARGESGGSGGGVAYAENGKSVGTFAAGVGFRVVDAATGKRVREAPSELKVGGRPDGRQPTPVLAPGLRWMAFTTGRDAHTRVLVIDPVSGRDVTAYPLRHGGWDSRVGFSPDGGRMVIGDSSSAQTSVWVCDPSVGRVVTELRFDGGYAIAVGLNRDGSRVAALTAPHGDDAPQPAVRVWDVGTGKQLRALPVRNFVHESMVLSPDGATVAVTSREAASPTDYPMATVVRLLDVANGEVVRRLVSRVEYGRLVYSPDGRRLAVGSGGRVEVFDTATGRVVPDPTDVVDATREAAHAYRSVEFRPDGSLQLRGRAGGVELWNPATGRRTQVVPVPPGGAYIHALSPDGRRLVYTVGRTIHDQERRLWDRDRKAEVARVTHEGVVMPRFDYTPEGRLFMQPQRAGPADHDVWELDPATLEPLRTVELGRPFQNVPLWTGRVAAFGTRRFEFPIAGAHETPTGTARQWDAATGREGVLIRWAPEGATLRDGVGPVQYLRARGVSPNGRWLVVCQFVGRRGPVRNDGRSRDTGDDVVGVYDTADGREKARFVVPPEGFVGEAYQRPRIAVSPDGRRVAVTIEGPTCRVFDTASGAERRRLCGWTGSGRPGSYHLMYDAQYSPDGRYLLTSGAADGVVVWDANY